MHKLKSVFWLIMALDVILEYVVCKNFNRFFFIEIAVDTAYVETNTVFWHEVLSWGKLFWPFLINCCHPGREVMRSWLKRLTLNSTLHWFSRWLPFSEVPVMVATTWKVKFCGCIYCTLCISDVHIVRMC